MNRCNLVAFMLIMFAGTGIAFAETLPSRGMVDERVRTALYRDGEIYRLQGHVGYALELVFEAGEGFAGQGGGDLEGIAFGWHENHLILKPKAANVGTNLVIYTNRRAYRFDYAVSARKPDSLLEEVMYTVQFLYPPKPLPADPAMVAAKTEQALDAAPSVSNIDYWYCGAPSLKPISTTDDGVHTRIRFAARAELPAIFVRNDDDSESLLNFSVQEDEVVIHRVAPRLILRRGKLTGCIVNQGYAGSGARLSTGTITPAVQRQRKEAR